MERVTGSMGSEYVRFRLDPEAVPLLTEKFDWNLLARRVFIDPVTGFVDLMTPSSTHERFSRGADRVMDAIARRGRPVASLGSTRWRRPEDPTNTGAEPDACYYLGDRAERLDKIDPLDEDEHDAFALENPPDLVIEVDAAAATGTSRLPIAASASRKCGASTYRAMSARRSCWICRPRTVRRNSKAPSCCPARLPHSCWKRSPWRSEGDSRNSMR